MRILIVEDDFASRKFMMNFMSAYGDCDGTVDGMEAVEAYMLSLIHIYITDLSVTERANKGSSFAVQQPVRFKGITVRDILELAAGKPLSENQLCDCLRDVGLCAKDYIGRELNGSLSGGEIKRIEIAMVMLRLSLIHICACLRIGAIYSTIAR